MTAMICQDAPGAIKAAGEALLVDQTAAGDTVAQFLGIPFITVCCALAINRNTTSPFFTPWGYQNTWWARIRNQVAYYLLDRNSQPINKSSITIAVSGGLQQLQCFLFSTCPNQPTACRFWFSLYALPVLPLWTIAQLWSAIGSLSLERLTGQPLIYLHWGLCRTPSRRFFTASPQPAIN